jgi:hypothetical protein
VNEAEKALPRDDGTEPETILRAKYLDYCSAQVADILLLLSADEMYVLAHDAARDSGVSDELSLSYEEIVHLATERVSRKLALPPFEAWVEEYLTDPDRFEQQMLGLWVSELDNPPRNPED